MYLTKMWLTGGERDCCFRWQNFCAPSNRYFYLASPQEVWTRYDTNTSDTKLFGWNGAWWKQFGWGEVQIRHHFSRMNPPRQRNGYYNTKWSWVHGVDVGFCEPILMSPLMRNKLGTTTKIMGTKWNKPYTLHHSNKMNKSSLYIDLFILLGWCKG